MSNRKTRQVYRVTIGFCAAALLASAGQTQTRAYNQSNSQNSTSNVQNSTSNTQNQTGMNNPDQMQSPRAQKSRQLSMLLNCTNKARPAISNGNTAQARTDINQALEAASSLGGSTGIVPLYSGLDQYSVLGPIRASRMRSSGSTYSGSGSNYSGSADRSAAGSNSSNQVSQSGQQNNQYQSQSGTQQMSGQNGNIGVRQVEGQFTSIGLDANMAAQDLRAAKQALSNGDMQTADRDLRAVQDNVVLVSVGSDMPLVQARENLALARMAAKQGNYQEVHADLNAACRTLGTYGEEGARYSSAAGNLRSQIENYNQSIQSNHADASSQIASWWDQTAGWNSTTGSNNSTNSTGSATTSR